MNQKATGSTLRELAKVNYFIGPNGSGKSKLLFSVFQKNYTKALFIRDSITARQFDLIQDKFCELSNLDQKPSSHASEYFWNQENILILDLIRQDLVKKYPKNIKKTLNWLFAKTPELELGFDFQESLSSLEFSSGSRKVLHLILGILLTKQKKPDLKYICIEEIDSKLHPKTQKTLALILTSIAEYLDLQFFVTTHSPFVISGINFSLDNDKYNPKNKVYFLKNGLLVDKKGNSKNPKAEYGYWGNKVAYIAASMVGAGISDLIYKNPRSSTNSQTAMLIFCEGEGADSDSTFYNRLFKKYKPNCLFVSSRGTTQLYSSFRLAEEIKLGLSSDIQFSLHNSTLNNFADITDIYNLFPVVGCKPRASMNLFC